MNAPFCLSGLLNILNMSNIGCQVFENVLISFDFRSATGKDDFLVSGQENDLIKSH